MNSQSRLVTLASKLEIGGESCISIIGGGGKTTLLHLLTTELTATGRSVVVTTTTKFWPPDMVTLVLSEDGPAASAAVAIELLPGRVVALGHHLSDSGKVVGISRQTVCGLLSTGLGPILVEADGASSRPLKAHGTKEPVVPACSTHVLIVAGLDAAGRPADESTVHRAEEYTRVTGSELGTLITPGDIAHALASALRYCPATSSSTFVLNKVDGDRSGQVARRVAEHLRRVSPECAIASTSWGSLINWWDGTMPDRFDS